MLLPGSEGLRGMAGWDMLAAAAGLGAFHGINPAMGWLFAVFLATQRRSGQVLGRSLLVVGAGHTASVAVLAALVALARSTLPAGPVRVGCALALLAFGLYRLVRYYRHPGWASLNVTYRSLFSWSFLMATAHGSGLMLAPLFVAAPHGSHSAAMVLAHLAGLMVTMSAISAIVYWRLGIGVLRRLWINFDLVWGLALVLAGLVAVRASVGP